MVKTSTDLPIGAHLSLTDRGSPGFSSTLPGRRSANMASAAPDKNEFPDIDWLHILLLILCMAFGLLACKIARFLHPSLSLRITPADKQLF